ncbi:MAG: PASTA domain-containing protein [Muribaculaceae bacterium]|nr:PASTA domain-containing protein [Muribaculaceae bacterium]
MNFFKRHLILTNLLLMAAVAVIILMLAMWGLRVWTGHGVVQVVPNVEGLSLDDARKSLAQYNLHAEVVDSLHSDTAPRGSVLDQVPKPGDRVKPGRDIYLTINAYSVKTISVPDLTGCSGRQASATLASLGFRNVKVVMVPSDFKDLVLAVKTMGVTLRPGTQLPPDASLEIEVGEGAGAAFEADSDSEYRPTFDDSYSDEPIQWPD